MRNILILVVFIFNAFLVAAFFMYAPSYTIKNKIEKNLQQYDYLQTNLPEAYNAHWDEVCIFAEGVSPAEIDATLGYQWYARFKTNIVHNHRISLLVFLNKQGVVSHVQFPNETANFSTVTTKGCFNKSIARFSRAPTGEMALSEK